jgi:hypothetical protein
MITSKALHELISLCNAVAYQRKEVTAKQPKPKESATNSKFWPLVYEDKDMSGNQFLQVQYHFPKRTALVSTQSVTHLVKQVVDLEMSRTLGVDVSSKSVACYHYQYHNRQKFFGTFVPLMTQ